MKRIFDVTLELDTDIPLDPDFDRGVTAPDLGEDVLHQRLNGLFEGTLRGTRATAVREVTPDPQLETPRMLVLSTSHITAETNTMFAFCTDDVPQFFPKAPWGAPDDNLGWIIPLVEGEPFPHTCPGDLLGIHLLAIQHGCTWIMLDRDGPVVASLPTYDW